MIASFPQETNEKQLLLYLSAYVTSFLGLTEDRIDLMSDEAQNVSSCCLAALIKLSCDDSFLILLINNLSWIVRSFEDTHFDPESSFSKFFRKF